METRDIEALNETLEQLRSEIARLRGSRERLVLAADADRRLLERELHRGVQQQLVALAVDVQLAEEALGVDIVDARTRLRDMGRDVQLALDDAGRLAQRIHPPLLEAGGLAVALRAAATTRGARATINVVASTVHPPEIARTLYSCFLAALEDAAPGARATVAVREAGDTVVFEIATDSGSDTTLDGQRDRVEALGGRLTTRPAAGGGVRASGCLPLSR